MISYKIRFTTDYYPYVKTLRYFETAAFEEKFLTTQHERDRETGFDYRGARYYDSDLGRFLSLDPLAAQYPAWSDYVYVLGNPVMYIDPDGREAKETGWTDNHKYLNAVFGDRNGFNDIIDTGDGGDNDCCGEVWDMWDDMKSEAERQAEISQNGSSSSYNWYTPATQFSAVVATVATGTEIGGQYKNIQMYSQGFRKGLNGNYLLTGRNARWFRNMPMTKHTMPISGMSKFGRLFGRASLAGGIIIDGVGTINYYVDGSHSPNAVHPAKAMLNTGFAIWGVGIAKIGLRANPLAALLYFGVDAFYPGGFRQAMIDKGNHDSEVNRIYKSGGSPTKSFNSFNLSDHGGNFKH